MKVLFWPFLVASLIFPRLVFSIERVKSDRQREGEILTEIFSKDYDKMIRPSGEGGSGPTIVSVNLFVRSIQTIDDNNMEYKVQLTFRELWLDQRLRFDHYNDTGNLKYLTLTESEKVWKPDLFYSNEKTGIIHKNLKPNLYIRIFPNGEVLYSIRISLTLACPMQLRMFPLDTQTCQIKMASWGWTTEDLIFKWKDDGNPVQVTSDLQIFRFVLEEYTTDTCDSFSATGVYSCLKADFVFRREFRYYMINVYLPSCMLICVSWLSFWLDPRSVPARIAIGITTLLAISNQNSKINQSLPPVSYMKGKPEMSDWADFMLNDLIALDVWTGVSLNFIFCALLEFAMVNYASRCDKQKADIEKEMEEQRKKSEEEGEEQPENENGEYQYEMDNSPGSPSKSSYHTQMPQYSDDIPKKTMVLTENEGSTVRYDEDEERNEYDMCKRRTLNAYKECKHIGTGVSKSFISRFGISKAKRIDVISRITFPILFLFFNLSYWFAYLA